ncbi:T9SS type A sorting domain-containing protein [Maribellus comscasis]|uniref:T9SS type A sorting domain-containing protein n=1 Tax=Maribellus comscasis TaxID=2681766 RepID=A0A6I6JXA5_9BACT|nr:T9SS type A sorting domain-containing protein [Maribellus comscasis]QGY43763.1 T9SS type A sorting domain-containing protein [Maribellus comscasis]
MKRFLLSLLLMSFTFSFTFSQSLKFERYIQKTDTIIDENIVVDVSSDDAEQENDEMDDLEDDDLDVGYEYAPDEINIVHIGLRFRDIGIPAGATIDSAFVYVHSHEAKSAEDVANTTITGDNNPNPGTFSMDSLITDRSRTNASVSWVIAEEWGLYTEHRTPDISAIIQEIIDLPEWQAYNSLALILEGENQGVTGEEIENAREIESFENIADPEDGGDGQNHPERRPKLVIYYTLENQVFERYIQKTDTIIDENIVVDVSSDDAEQENNEMDDLEDDDLDIGYEYAPDEINIVHIGLRFRDIDIPAGFTVDSAFVYVHSHEAKSADDVANITITGENNPNPGTFTMDSLITDRPRTTASVRWVIAEEWGLYTEHRTPDIGTIIQEIIDLPGWEAGNSLALIWEGENQGVTGEEIENAREIESFENIADPEDGGDGQNHPERRPRLVVYYSSVATNTAQKQIIGFESDFKVYPNPVVSGSINLEFDDDKFNTVKMYDLTGKLVKSIQLESTVEKIDVSDLSKGIFFIQASNGKEISVTKKIIVD